MRRVRVVAALVALGFFLGLHWGMLQAVAWTRMLVEFSQSMPLGEAVARTFDGRHPCALCLEVRRGRQAESETIPGVVRPAVKLEFVLPKPVSPLLHAVEDPVVVLRETHAPARFEDPPKPRPRGLRVV